MRETKEIMGGGSNSNSRLEKNKLKGSETEDRGLDGAKKFVV